MKIKDVPPVNRVHVAIKMVEVFLESEEIAHRSERLSLQGKLCIFVIPVYSALAPELAKLVLDWVIEVNLSRIIS
jgi:hypothetical protein